MRYIKELRIRVQLTLLVAIIVVIVFFILILNYTKATQIVEKKNSNYITEMIAQMNQTIASNSNGLKRILENTAYNRTIVQEYLNESEATTKFELYSSLADYMSDMMSMKDGILDIALFGNDGTAFNLNGDITNLTPYISKIPEKRLFHYTGVHAMVISNFDRVVFIIGCPIYSITNFENTKRIGTLMMVVDASSLLGPAKSINGIDDAKLYATDRFGHVFFTNDETVSLGTSYGQDLSDNEDSKFFIQKGPIPDLEGELVFRIPQSELLRGIEDIRKQSFLILAASLLLLTIPLAMFVNNIVRPLKKLMSYMNEFKRGSLHHLSVRIELQGYAEIGSMASHFNRMLDEIDELTGSLLESNTKLYRAELVKKQAELAYLHSQINPHFLYNTLETIKGMAVEEGSDRIFQMVKSLAFAFRFSIKTADRITLKEEIALVQNHIYIQQIRFANRFTVEYRIQDDLLCCEVPKMILQPLVENAIFHGIEPKTGRGQLLIVVEQSNSDLLFSVIDDGAGIEEEKLRDIRLRLSSLTEPADVGHTRSIGLMNVNNRIKLYYGEPYGVTINSRWGKGTKVVIRIPAKEVSDV